MFSAVLTGGHALPSTLPSPQAKGFFFFSSDFSTDQRNTGHTYLKIKASKSNPDWYSFWYSFWQRVLKGNESIEKGIS